MVCVARERRVEVVVVDDGGLRREAREAKSSGHVTREVRQVGGKLISLLEGVLL